MPLAPQRLSLLPADLDHPAALAVQSNGTIYASGEAGQLYRLTKNAKHAELILTLQEPVTALALSLQNSWLAIATPAGLHRLNLPSGKLTSITTYSGVAGGLCFLPSGDLVVSDRTKPARGTLVLIDHNQRVTPCKTGPMPDPRGMALSANGATLYIACREVGVMTAEITDGIPGQARLWVKLKETLPEAIAMDHRSNAYVGCHVPARVLKIAPDKWVTTHVEDVRMETLSQPVALAWTGKKFDQLLIANRGARHITRIDMQQIGLGAINQR